MLQLKVNRNKKPYDFELEKKKKPTKTHKNHTAALEKILHW